MALQMGAVTGKKKRSPLQELLRAESAWMPEKYAIEEEKAYREELGGIQAGMLALAEERARHEQEQAEEAQETAEKNVLISTAIAAAGVAPSLIKGGQAVAAGIKGLTATAATPASAGALANVGAGETILAGAPGTAQAGATGAKGVLGTAGKAALKYAGPAAAVGALELLRTQGGEYLEEQVGTSAKHAGRIGARALQGAVLGTSIFPGIGTGVGAIGGAALGALEESWGWLERQTVVGKVGSWFEEQGIFDWF